MGSYLVFPLYGPLAAWGGIAVGEVRGSDMRPGKSAVVGLLSGALGWERTEQEKIDGLSRSYKLAVKLLSVGTPLKDYHTIQAPDDGHRYTYRTRRDELIVGKSRLGTMLSSREYRCDSIAIIALRPVDGAEPSPDELKNALLRPRFIPYLGRKSCPPALPIRPRLEEARGFREALDMISLDDVLACVPGGIDTTLRLFDTRTAHYYWEGEAGDMDAQQTVECRDDPGDRFRRQFHPRREHVAIFAEER